MIKILADSTCDLSEDLLERHNITLVPLYVIIGDQSHRDGVDATPQDIFQFVESGKGICKTAAINIKDYEDVFAQYADDYDAVIHINLSSGLSSCHQNACLAAEYFDNVYVIDSKNLSTGSGHAVLKAAELAEEGFPAEEIVKMVEDLVPRVEASFVIDTLKYLYKGGRCSALTALGANILGLKPCIEVGTQEGTMDVGKKYRGNIEKSIINYVNERLEGRDDIDKKRIFITHSGCSREVVDSVRKAIKNHMEFEEVLETTAGCTISNHCGPNTLGILFVKTVQ